MPVDPLGASSPTVLVELTVYDPALPGTRVLYYADREFRTGAADTPASTVYRRRLRNPGTLALDLIAAWSKGTATFGIGEISLINTDGGLDTLRNYTFDGWGAVFYLATRTAAGVLTKREIFRGTMEDPDVGKRAVTVPIRSSTYGLDKPVTTSVFLGTGGVEGDSTVRGKIKPVIYGITRNIPLILIDAANLIYYVSQNPLVFYPATPNRVRDSAAELIAQGGSGANYATLVGTVVAAGKYEFADNGGAGPTLIKLGSTPAGQVTMSLAQRNTPNYTDLPQVITTIMTDAGLTVTGVNRDVFYPVSGGFPYGDTITGEYGAYVDDNRTFAEVLAGLVASVAGWLWLNQLGPYWVLGNMPKTDTAGLTLFVVSDSDIVDMKKLGNPKTPGQGIPPKSITYEYDRNELVQTSGLAAGAPLAWRNYVGSQYQSRTKQDATVTTRYPLAMAITQTGRGMVASTPDTPSSDFLDGFWAALQLGWHFYQVEVKLSTRVLAAYVIDGGAVPWTPLMPSERDARFGIRTSRFGFTNTGKGTRVAAMAISVNLERKTITYIVRTTYQAAV